ncbi:hypothetical protein NQZ68_019940 [Dissostichus eleginoides]|nr:hypothetical protein NQZ68_019940 [Dissostichus eleginoides]
MSLYCANEAVNPNAAPTVPSEHLSCPGGWPAASRSNTVKNLTVNHSVTPLQEGGRRHRSPFYTFDKLEMKFQRKNLMLMRLSSPT